MACKVKGLGGWWMAVLLSVGSLAAAGDLRLVEAVEERDQEAVHSLLQERADVNAAQADGATALHWAAHWDDPETAELLIRAGADVNAANDYGVTPLWLACTNGSAAIAGKLLEAGANPNAALPTGETVLMMCARAGNAEAVNALLVHGADVNAAETRRGQTALMRAVAQKQPEAAKTLIEHGADVHARSNGGFTSLLFAAQQGDLESTRILLATGANVNEATPDGMCVLLVASASGHEALSIFLLEEGADPNAVDAYGATALHYAVMKGIASMSGVSLANYVSHLFRPSMPELVKALLAHGANPNARLVDGPRLAGRSLREAIGATPFLLAAAANDVSVMRILAENGADPLLATKGKLTPLAAAAGVGRVQDFTEAEEHNALEAVKLALDLGADVNAANDTSRTALHGAANLGGNVIIQFLADQGANLDVRDTYQQTPLSIASGVHLPWTPKGEELGEVIRKETADLLLQLGATPLTAPDYFIPVELDSDVYQMNPKSRPVPGVQ